MNIKFCNSHIAITIALLLSPSISQAEEDSDTRTAGDILQILIPATAYATTFVIDDEEGRTQFYKSFFTNLGITHALKVTVDKPRQENGGNYSFPSGHTSSAFQGAAFIQKRYGWKYGAPAYIGAAFVGWSRVEGESDQHDFYDVAAGAAIGILSAYYFTTPYRNMTVTPVVGTDATGINVSVSW